MAMTGTEFLAFALELVSSSSMRLGVATASRAPEDEASGSNGGVGDTRVLDDARESRPLAFATPLPLPLPLLLLFLI
jgi:hypothetical protein